MQFFIPSRTGLARREGGPLLALAVLCAIAFALRFGLALAAPNLHRPDEVFQNLEPAYRMWTGHGVITWEWRVGLRSPLFPGFLAGLIGAGSFWGLARRAIWR